MTHSHPWALVTGATSGIGLATAEALSRKNYNLIITGRRKERLVEFQKKRQSPTSQILPIAFDIRNAREMEQAFAPHHDALNQVRILVNNAGLARGVDPVDKASTSDWNLMIDTNIKGLFQTTHFMLPFLKNQTNATIVNVGSVAGRWTYPGGAVYCATKQAVLAFSEGLRKDLCGHNIRVVCIEPGLVDTEFSEVRLGSKEKADAVYQGMQPLKGEDIAESIVWCIERPPHVNVQEIVLFPTAQASVTQVHRT